ncbi:MAG: GNAT family N-acetyltransferase [Kangiellaceae bacterium]|nr:GNAT family N-acetyltransferase [Kangiellaceae bacterium]
MIICETERLIIRHFKLSDSEFILDLLNQKSFIKYIKDKNVRTITDAEEYLKQGPMNSYITHGFGLNLIQDKGANKPIGVCGILKRDHLDYPDLGYALSEKHSNKGYALEASKAVIQNAVTDLHFNKILAITNYNNTSSIRLLKKLNFKVIGSIKFYEDQPEEMLLEYSASKAINK